MLDLSDKWAGFKLHCPPVDGYAVTVGLRYNLFVYRTANNIAVQITKTNLGSGKITQEARYVRSLDSLLRLIGRRLRTTVNSSTLDELIRYIEVETTKREP